MGTLRGLPLEEELETRVHGLDAESRRYVTFRAVETLLEHAALREPFALVCEDLHWADSTSLALLGQLLPLIAPGVGVAPPSTQRIARSATSSASLAIDAGEEPSALLLTTSNASPRAAAMTSTIRCRVSGSSSTRRSKGS